jgi:hypothetical protein
VARALKQSESVMPKTPFPPASADTENTPHKQEQRAS